MDPFGPSKGLSLVPFAGEVCLLFGMFILIYVGCEGLDKILMMPMGSLMVLGGVGLVLVSMVCMWYTQWIYGAYAREVYKMMAVVYQQQEIPSTVSQHTTTVVTTPPLTDHVPAPPATTSPVAVPTASPVMAAKKTLSTTDITSVADIDNFISPFMSPSITPSITRRNSITETVANRSSEAIAKLETDESDTEEVQTNAPSDVFPESQDVKKHEVQSFVPVQVLDQSHVSVLETAPFPSEITIPLWIHLRVLLYFTAGWVWTIASLTILLPLFSMPFYYSMGAAPITRSFLIGPLVRALQGYLMQK